MPDILVRPATESDLVAILDIYNERILNSTATFDIKPQTLAQKRRWLRETKRPHCVLVADRAGEVVGWACLRPFRAKEAYRYTAENSVYVRKDAWGQQVGSALMSQLVRAGETHGFHSIIAGIALPNPASVRLHERFGFVLVGVEREVGYKFGRWVDVAWMQRMLGD